MPRVSVLMPVYNAAPFVAQAVESVLAQKFDDFELLVINDGSTDNSSQILRKFGQRDPRLSLLERHNKGLIHTRNELLELSTGEFIAWMDADDISLPTRLAEQVARFTNDASLVCIGTMAELIDPSGKTLGMETYPVLDSEIRSEQRNGGGFRFPTTMQRRSAAMVVGGFREPFRLGEDLDFLLRLADQGRLSNVAAPLYLYRQHLLSTCAALGQNWPEIQSLILELAEERLNIGSDRLQRGEPIDFPAISPGSAKAFRPTVLIDWAQRATNAGDRLRALRYTAAAISVNPLERAGWRTLAKILLQRRF